MSRLSSLVAVLAREDSLHTAKHLERAVLVASKHDLTLETLLCGQRVNGVVPAHGYVGIWDGFGGCSASKLARICTAMQCSPQTALVSLMEQR